MTKHFISNNDESVPMFKNKILDKFSRIHWFVPLIIFVPLVIYFLYISFVNTNLSILQIMLLYLVGCLAWSLIEYLLHRFVFHYPPKTEFGKRIHFMFHGVHHDYPQDSKRLVMVPSVSIPLALGFYFLFLFILGSQLINPFFSGLITGYLAYDMIHYGVHHFGFRNKFFLKLKQYHMKHHYLHPEKGFGVSSPIWDYVFKTTYPKK